MDTLRTDVPPEILEAMGVEGVTEEQWAAISMPLEPYVLVAGAGSGKTSVMAARVVYLALVALGRIDADHDGALPGNVLCLTFTNKATENLQLRVRRALATIELPEGEEPAIDNYHGFAAQVLDRFGLLAGIEPGQRVLSQAQRVELCGRVLDRMTFEDVRTEWQPTVVAKILELDDQMANHLVSPERVVEFNRTRLQELAGHRSDRAYSSALERIELAQAAGVYRKLKRELGVIDFSDQIELALRVVREHPEVGEQYRSRFTVVLLDEYQDTNVAQARLMEGIFGGGHPVTAVGDPDQNIYAWRGASLFNLLEFPEQFPRADGTPARRLPLYTNFRSGARILHAADRLIDELPTSQRPDPDKALVPWPANGEGDVEILLQPDEWTEASAIADRVVRLHEEGAAWSDVAVLCRTSRLFTLLQRAFDERDVPVEILGLAGLLRLPAIVEVLSYARAVLDPLASVALARILLGPRYRVGFKDLALVASLAKEETRRLIREDEDEGESNPYLFAEALERLDEVEGLSDEGRARLTELRDELRELRVEARKPVPEFLSEVIRRTGILTELDADLDRPTAQAAKRNLAAFLDEVHRFEPVEGELTLRAFLEYVDAVERMDKPEWSPVQPSDEDSVKVMTIHVAKGLEFDHVFVPGLAKGAFPDTRVQHNPAERGKSLDFELRGDAAILPRYDGVLSHFKAALTKQEEIEERRTAYVALTRARKELVLSASHWYGENVNARGPGSFFEELVGWSEGGEATVALGGPAPEENPMLGQRARFARPWPGPAVREQERDGLFPEGWRHAAAAATASGGVQPSLVEALPADERARFDELAVDRRRLASHLKEREGAATADEPWLPSTIAVSGVIDYARCPKRFYWSQVRPLPRFSGPAARIGTEVHRWIERKASGQASLIELDESPDLTAEELAGEPGKVERLRQAFQASRFAGRVPRYAERAFLLSLDGFRVGGRIDAIYGEDDGPWEVVDWKTGRKPVEDPLASLQLDVYGLACVDIWRKRPEDLTLTYLYLASEEEVSHPMGDAEEVRTRVIEALRSMAAGEFAPTPGAHCGHCDFLAFCDSGRAWVNASAR